MRRYAHVNLPGDRVVDEHRFLWEKANGPIPPGFHIHHKDRNPRNNDLSNLEMIDHREHARLHALERMKDPATQAAMQRGVREAVARLRPVDVACSECGKAFQSTGQPGRPPASMCSQLCRHRRWVRNNRERSRELARNAYWRNHERTT